MATKTARADTVENRVESYLESRLPGIFQSLAKKINIAELMAASGSMRDLKISKVDLGEAKIEKLTLQGTAATLHSASALAKNVRIVLHLSFVLEYWIWMPWPFDDIHGSASLGTLNIPMNLGNISIPSLENIDLTIPTVAVENLNADMPPITNLNLGGGSFNNLKATKTTLPADGFQVNGLNIGGFSLSNIGVPKTYTQEATLQQFKPSLDLVLPGAQVAQLQIPSTTIPTIQTNAFSFPASASAQCTGTLNLGVLKVRLCVHPSVDVSIASLYLQDVALSATINQAKIENIHIPINIHGVTINDLSMVNLNVNNVSD